VATAVILGDGNDIGLGGFPDQLFDALGRELAQGGV
jgi:hypothetical protein